MKPEGLCVTINPNTYGLIDDRTGQYYLYSIRFSNQHPELGKCVTTGRHLGDEIYEHFDSRPSAWFEMSTLAYPGKSIPVESAAGVKFERTDIDLSDNTPSKPEKKDVVEVTILGHEAEPMKEFLRHVGSKGIPLYDFHGTPKTPEELIGDLSTAIEATKTDMPNIKRLWDGINKTRCEDEKERHQRRFSQEKIRTLANAEPVENNNPLELLRRKPPLE